MFKLKVYSHCHDFRSDKVNEVKINFYSPSIDHWSVWTRGEILAMSQAELILSCSTCNDWPLCNVTECITSPCTCQGSSDEFSVGDLQPGHPQDHTCPATWEWRVLDSAAAASEHEAGCRRNFSAQTKPFPPHEALLSRLRPLTSGMLAVCIVLLMYRRPRVVISLLSAYITAPKPSRLTSFSSKRNLLCN